MKAAASDIVCSAYSLLGMSTIDQVKDKVEWLTKGGHFHYGEVNLDVC